MSADDAVDGSPTQASATGSRSWHRNQAEAKRRGRRTWEGRTGCNATAGRYRKAVKPTCARAPRARAFGRDPSSRKALWPAVMRTAPTGRTHGRTDQAQQNIRSPLPTESRSLIAPVSSSQNLMSPARVMVLFAVGKRRRSIWSGPRRRCCRVHNGLALMARPRPLSAQSPTPSPKATLTSCWRMFRRRYGALPYGFACRKS